jgi:hypothetical protein
VEVERVLTDNSFEMFHCERKKRNKIGLRKGLLRNVLLEPENDKMSFLSSCFVVVVVRGFEFREPLG